jgi:hypothetical protein
VEMVKQLNDTLLHRLRRKLGTRIQTAGSRLWAWGSYLRQHHWGTVISLLLLAIAVGVDLWAERNSQIENCVPLEERGSVNTPMRAFLPSPFRPHSRYTAIVSLKPEVEPNEIFHDGCQLKEYLAKLVGRIDSEGPALIVTDIFARNNSMGVLEIEITRANRRHFLVPCSRRKLPPARNSCVPDRLEGERKRGGHRNQVGRG